MTKHGDHQKNIRTVPVPDWQKEELDRRKQDFAKNPSSAIRWNDAKKQIRAQYD